MTYTINPIEDTISLEENPGDGYSYCGDRKYQYIEIEPLEGQPTPADSMVTFDPFTETFSVQGSDSSEYGKYKVKFTVGLEKYPGLVPQEQWFEVLIAPNCLASTVSASGAIVFTTAATGTTQKFPDVAALFSYD